MDSSHVTRTGGNRYRWVILALCGLAVIVVNGATLIFSGMAGFLMTPVSAGGEYDFTAQQFMMLTSCPYLAGFLGCLAMGVLADRRGIRSAMLLGLSLSLAAAVARVFTDGFAGMLITSTVYGFGLAALNANVAKIMRLWFDRNMVNVAMGVYLACATAGAAIFIPLASSFTSVQPMFVIVALLSAVTLAAWALLYRKHPEGERPVVEPVVKQLREVMRSRDLWIACVIIGLVMAAGAVNNGNLVAWLSGAKGIDVTTAAFAASLCNISCSLGGILFPAIIARVHGEKGWIAGLALAAAAGTALYYWGLPAGLCVTGVIIASCLVGGYLPLVKALPAQLPGIARENLGAAGGLHATVQNALAFLIPSFVVGPLITAADGSMNYDVLQVCYIVMTLVVAGLTLCLPKLATADVPARTQTHDAEGTLRPGRA